MRRIGVAASKIAKGNIWLYNLSVVAMACLLGLFVFLVCGFSIAVTLFVLSVLIQRLSPSGGDTAWLDVFKISLNILGALTGFFTLVAISKNIKLKLKL